MSSLTLRTVLQQADRTIALARRDAPRLSAELLIAEAMGLSRLELLLRLDQPISPEEYSRVRDNIQRRAKGEPVAYIRGYKEFYGRNFFVSPGVLIPRPESELLIDLALDLFGPEAAFRFADLCTGSGNLGISMASERSFSRGIGTEISRRAVQAADKNRRHHGLGHRFALAQASLGSCLRKSSFEAVLCNPPYLSEAEVASVSPEISGFEPIGALRGGREGQELSLQVLKAAEHILKPCGILLLETGPGQAGPLYQAARMSPCWQELCLHRDLAGKDRVLCAVRCGL